WILVVSCVVVYGCILPFNNISSSLLLERDYFREPGSQCQLTDIYDCQSDENRPLNCPSSQWFQPPLPHNATVDGKTYDPLHADDVDCAQDSWKDGCTRDYCNRESKAETQVSIIMSIPYIISAVLSPPLGFAIDIYGMRAVIALLAPMLLIVVHAVLGYTRMSPVLPLVGQGLAYTGFVSVLWPAIPLVVEDRVVGLAFGIVSSMQNFACAVIPLMVASIYSDSGNTYIPNVELLFVLLAVVGTAVGVYMNYYDYFYGDNILNSPCMIDVDGNEGGDGDRKISLSSSQDPASQSSQGAAAADSSALLGAQGRFEGERAQSVDVHQLRQQRASGSIHKQYKDGYSHSRRGASFTAYEEVLRGGGYRAGPRKKATH
ncbi:MFS transporter, partial [archaeon]